MSDEEGERFAEDLALLVDSLTADSSFRSRPALTLPALCRWLWERDAGGYLEALYNGNTPQHAYSYRQEYARALVAAGELAGDIAVREPPGWALPEMLNELMKGETEWQATDKARKERAMRTQSAKMTTKLVADSNAPKDRVYLIRALPNVRASRVVFGIDPARGPDQTVIVIGQAVKKPL